MWLLLCGKPNHKWKREVSVITSHHRGHCKESFGQDFLFRNIFLKLLLVTLCIELQISLTVLRAITKSVKYKIKKKYRKMNTFGTHMYESPYNMDVR